MLKKFPRWFLWSLLSMIVLIALVPAFSLFSMNTPRSTYAAGSPHPPVIPHLAHHAKPQPHHTSAGVDRTRLHTLPVLAGQAKRSSKGKTQEGGAFIGSNVSPQTATTLFFDNMESGATGWTTVGDNQSTSYYPGGHDFWNLALKPNTLTVPTTVNPSLVSYPGASAALPAAYSGTHAWWYGDNPAVDTANPSGASITYMGNQSDWPNETSNNGGTSNGANTAALISPPISLASVPDATLSFATWWEIESTNPAHFDMMYIDVTNNAGTSWTTIGVLNPSSNPDGGTDPYPYTNNGLDASASWQIASADLTPYVGSTVQIRFRFDSIDQYDNGFRGWFIDDVGVYSTPSGSPLVSNVTPANGVAGDPVTISGSGFGASQSTSTVTISGKSAVVQSWSDSSIVATVPMGVRSGPLVVTVNGNATSAINFIINATISLSYPTTVPVITDQVSGQGFGASEPVSIYVNGIKGTLLARANADTNGNLLANVSIPALATGNYLFFTVGKNSHVTAGTTLSIIPALTLSSTSIAANQNITLTGKGFAGSDYVSMYVDDPTKGSPIGYLFCDATGTCSGYATAPNSGVLQGLHILIGVSYYTALVAETPVTLIPGITPDVTSGGPGTAITLNGAAFTANETVNVYWGGTTGILEGSTTTDASGNLVFTFNAPVTGVSPGYYTITAARTKHKPATAVAQFQIAPPTFSSTSGIQSGEAIYVQVANFAANEQVNITWNADNGQPQPLTTLFADSTGYVYNVFTPPSAPVGTYTLTATGATSGIQMTSPLSIGPGVVLTPNSANPGGTITVAGGGFSANEALQVYFQSTANGVIAVTTDATGAFSTPLTLPKTYTSTTAYTVYATNTAATEQASAPFYFSTPSLAANNYYVNYGAQITLYGQGFVANDTVTLYWNYKQTGQLTVGTVQAASDGTFTTTITVPSDPNLSSVTVAVIGTTGKLKATASLYEYANLVLTPSSGPIGTVVQVTGGGFDKAETVTVSYQGVTIATVIANGSGAIKAKFTVPAATTLGYTTVSAVGSTSGISVSATFTVTPVIAITPTTGPSGTIITVNGKHFSASSTGSLYWYDPTTSNYTYLGAFTSSSTGTFKMKITAPAGLTSGNTYYVQAYDGQTGFFTQAAFIAQ